MSGLVDLLLTIAGAYAFAVALWPILRWPSFRFRLISFFCASPLLFFPLLVDAEHIGLRALVAVVCIELWFKAIDYARQCNVGGTQSQLGDYGAFLVPFPLMLVVYSQKWRRLDRAVPRRPAVLMMLLGLAMFGSGFVLLSLLSEIPTVTSSYPLEHLVKVFVFVLAVEGLSWFLLGAERLAGLDTTPVMRNLLRSRSVGEFWCRYNTRVHAWFDRNVFRPAGGRQSPARGLLAVFLVSGVVHEIGFAIATSRVDGYQFAFFMIQVPAVVLTRRFGSIADSSGGLRKLVVHGVTVSWLVVSSVLFFHGVDRVFPFFYESEPWLP